MAFTWVQVTASQIFSSPSIFSMFFEIVPRAPTMTGITVTFMSHNFFQLSSKVQVFIKFFAFLYFHSDLLERLSQLVDKFFLLKKVKSGLLVRIGWPFFLSQNPRESLYVSSSRTYYGLCIYHLIVWLKFSHLYSGSLSPPNCTCFCTLMSPCCIHSLDDFLFHLSLSLSLSSVNWSLLYYYYNWFL